MPPVAMIPLFQHLRPWINWKYDLHISIVAVYSQTLQQARYKVRMALNILELKYLHCNAFPLYSTSHCAGNSPCIWLFISQPFLTCMLHLLLAHLFPPLRVKLPFNWQWYDFLMIPREHLIIFNHQNATRCPTLEWLTLQYRWLSWTWKIFLSLFTLFFLPK